MSSFNDNEVSFVLRASNAVKLNLPSSQEDFFRNGISMIFDINWNQLLNMNDSANGVYQLEWNAEIPPTSSTSISPFPNLDLYLNIVHHSFGPGPAWNPRYLYDHGLRRLKGGFQTGYLGHLSSQSVYIPANGLLQFAAQPDLTNVGEYIISQPDNITGQPGPEINHHFQNNIRALVSYKNLKPLAKIVKAPSSEVRLQILPQSSSFSAEPAVVGLIWNGLMNETPYPPVNGADLVGEDFVEEIKTIANIHIECKLIRIA